MEQIKRVGLKKFPFQDRDVSILVTKSDRWHFRTTSRPTEGLKQRNSNLVVPGEKVLTPILLEDLTTVLTENQELAWRCVFTSCSS